MAAHVASVRRLAGVIGLLSAIVLPAVARAQTTEDRSRDATTIACADDGSCAMLLPVTVAVTARTLKMRISEWRDSFATWRTDAGVLFPLYGGYIGLQMLDVHSTTRAIDGGGVERNMVMSGVAGHPAALLLVKGAATAGTIYLIEDKIRKRNRILAIATTVGTNAAYALIVAHNYRSGK